MELPHQLQPVSVEPGDKFFFFYKQDPGLCNLKLEARPLAT